MNRFFSWLLGREKGLVYAFDFFNTLTHHADLRKMANGMIERGDEVHIVTAISPGLPADNDAWYMGELRKLGVRWTKIHRVDHHPKLKVEVLLRIGAEGFWDDLEENVECARKAGIPSCWVGKDNHQVLSLVAWNHRSRDRRPL